MALLDLLNLGDEEEYRRYYIDTLVKGPDVITPDGVLIEFYEERFYDAFYGRTSEWQDDKDIFDLKRAERMAWIRTLLMDPNADMRREPGVGNRDFRIVLYHPDPYQIVTKEMKPGKEKFITAYPCSRERLAMKCKLEKWTKK